jgi:hypothetical protein
VGSGLPRMAAKSWQTGTDRCTNNGVVELHSHSSVLLAAVPGCWYAAVASQLGGSPVRLSAIARTRSVVACAKLTKMPVRSRGRRPFLSCPLWRSSLRTHSQPIMLDRENVAIEGGGPLLTLHRHFEITQASPNGDRSNNCG